MKENFSEFSVKHLRAALVISIQIPPTFTLHVLITLPSLSRFVQAILEYRPSGDTSISKTSMSPGLTREFSLAPLRHKLP